MGRVDINISREEPKFAQKSKTFVIPSKRQGRVERCESEIVTPEHLSGVQSGFRLDSR